MIPGIFKSDAGALFACARLVAAIPSPARCPSWSRSLSALIAGLLFAYITGVSALGHEKPVGIYSSAGAGSNPSDAKSIYGDVQLKGVLIRASWSALEPSPGKFDFSSLSAQVANVKSKGLGWSLAVLGGGIGSPSWLTAGATEGGLAAPYVNYSFRGTPGYRLPLFWDDTVQIRLQLLAQALADRYGSEASLKLIYVTQMTSNGIEGHLQGVNMQDLVAAGYTDAKWIDAGERAARSFASAFPRHALAFEVHDVNGGAAVPETIINDLWNDPTLGQRVGAAMWWISGRTDYQAALLAALDRFPGDIYGQVIANSSTTTAFPNGDYAAVFVQAKQLGLRYIEPWDYEFTDTTNSAHRKWDAVFADFNAWAAATFSYPVLEDSDTHLVNLSARAETTAANPLMAGFVLSGEGEQSVLLRAVGPSLGAYGVSNLLSDPRLQLYRGDTLVGENDDWQQSMDPAALQRSMSQAGAFPLQPQSRDAALLVRLSPGAYSVHAQPANGVGGVVLLEIYALDSAAGPHLSNLSCRTKASDNGEPALAGFVLAGNGPRRVLVRAVGPSLGAFGVSDPVVDPQLQLYAGASFLISNDDWGRGGDAASVAAYASQAGAFALMADSRDAALLALLSTGGYSLRSSGRGGDLLLEIYAP